MASSGRSDAEPGQAAAAAEPLLAQMRARLGELERAVARLATEPPSEERGAPSGDARAEPPPAGWQRPAGDASARAGAGTLAELLRGALPPELARQLADAVRELLLALRALIDWCLERLERRRRAPVEVEDIPIA